MTDEEKVKLALVLKLLDDGTPADTPARTELIQKTAERWLIEQRRMQRIISKRR